MEEPVNTPVPVACIHLPFQAGGEVPGETGASETRRGRTQPTRQAPSPPAPSTAYWPLHTKGFPASSPSRRRLSRSEKSHVGPYEVRSVSYSREETARKTTQRRRPPSRPRRRLLQCEPHERQKVGQPAGSTVLHREAGD